MKPDLKDYYILRDNQNFWVLDPYDLFTMPCLKITGRPQKTLSDALECRDFLFDFHMKEYERLELQGRSFPDND